MGISMKLLCAGACAWGVLSGATARAQGDLPLIPPVDGSIARRWQAPGSEYGPGHRGVDFDAPPGGPVRAAAAGAVTFAGAVAGFQAVTVAHGGGLETTYSRMGDVYVSAGQEVPRGQWLGTVSGAHADGGGLHLGAKVDGRYVDPERYLGALDVSRAVHLAPLEEAPGDRCARPTLGEAPPPPNDNVAIAVAGIASETAGAGVGRYRSWLRSLGYRAGDAFVFSYRGPRGPDLHAPYRRGDTYAGLRAAAVRLRSLLVRIARARPGADVDLVAHSQGGVVVRALLEQPAMSSAPGLPRVEHVVTLGAPHSGAPLAGAVGARRRTFMGGGALGLLSALAAAGWLPIPSAGSEAVRDLVPGSHLLGALARQDVAYGARFLNIAMPHDVIVPADRTEMPHELYRVVPPRGLWGHATILSSPEMRALAYDFMRDAPEPCATMWDVLGPVTGRLVGWSQWALGRLLP
jgi:hypothetical protein